MSSEIAAFRFESLVDFSKLNVFFEQVLASSVSVNQRLDELFAAYARVDSRLNTLETQSVQLSDHALRIADRVEEVHAKSTATEARVVEHASAVAEQLSAAEERTEQLSAEVEANFESVVQELRSSAAELTAGAMTLSAEIDAVRRTAESVRSETAAHVTVQAQEVRSEIAAVREESTKTVQLLRSETQRNFEGIRELVEQEAAVEKAAIEEQKAVGAELARAVHTVTSTIMSHDAALLQHNDSLRTLHDPAVGPVAQIESAVKTMRTHLEDSVAAIKQTTKKELEATQAKLQKETYKTASVVTGKVEQVTAAQDSARQANEAELNKLRTAVASLTSKMHSKADQDAIERLEAQMSLVLSQLTATAAATGEEPAALGRIHFRCLSCDQVTPYEPHSHTVRYASPEPKRREHGQTLIGVDGRAYKGRIVPLVTESSSGRATPPPRPSTPGTPTPISPSPSMQTTPPDFAVSSPTGSPVPSRRKPIEPSPSSASSDYSGAALSAQSSVVVGPSTGLPPSPLLRRATSQRSVLPNGTH